MPTLSYIADTDNVQSQEKVLSTFIQAALADRVIDEHEVAQWWDIPVAQVQQDILALTQKGYLQQQQGGFQPTALRQAQLS